MDSDNDPRAIDWPEKQVARIDRLISGEVMDRLNELDEEIQGTDKAVARLSNRIRVVELLFDKLKASSGDSSRAQNLQSMNDRLVSDRLDALEETLYHGMEPYTQLDSRITQLEDKASGVAEPEFSPPIGRGTEAPVAGFSELKRLFEGQRVTQAEARVKGYLNDKPTGGVDRWQPTVAGGDAPATLEEWVFQALGSASMCWLVGDQHVSVGEFDIAQVKRIGEALLGKIVDEVGKHSDNAKLEVQNAAVGRVRDYMRDSFSQATINRVVQAIENSAGTDA